MGVSRGGVVGGPAGAHQIAKGYLVVAGENLEVRKEWPKITVIAGGEARLVDDIHALGMAPGVEGLTIDKAGAVLDIVSFARGHDERLDLGGLQVSSGVCSHWSRQLVPDPWMALWMPVSTPAK